ncbi:MAG: cysteine desulfurase [Vicinamibacterales bacterium]|jgi:cysteine desulfurase/selenocysteine lyase|nr:cysteine desulfurase [Vicinamibacterales bacterium]MDP6758727.1 cysteine desulfurase [Chloroflexota bacterium]
MAIADKSATTDGKTPGPGLRPDFPILERRINDRRLVYLDNAASSQKPESVLQALDGFYRHHNANVHRGIHTLSQEATDLYEGARAKVAAFVGARQASQIIWTRGTTESINLVAHSWGRKFLQPGDEILTTELEHHSNIVPWQFLAKATGSVLKYVPVPEHDTLLGADDFARMFTPRTRLVALTQMSNVVGTVLPVKEIAEIAHQHGAVVLVDGAQSVPHMPVDVVDLDVDFMAFSAHKMLGPTGVGALYGRMELLRTMDPYQGGGDMIATVSMEKSTWNAVPHKFEAGTPYISGPIGLGSAVDYLAALGMENVQAHEREITEYALESLGKIPRLTLYGPRDPLSRGAVIAFNVEDVHPHDIGQVLDSQGVAVRAGHHCAQPLMRVLGVGSTVRASFYVYNSRDDVDALVDAIATAKGYFSD